MQATRSRRADDELRTRKARPRLAPTPGTARAVHPMLALQRQIGNRATVSSLSRPVLQRIEEAEGTEHEGEQNIAEHEGEGEEAEGTEHREVAEH